MIETENELHGVPPTQIASECKIGEYLRTLPKTDADDLAFGIEAKVSATDLSLILHANNVIVGATTIKDHRRKVCACYRGARHG